MSKTMKKGGNKASTVEWSARTLSIGTQFPWYVMENEARGHTIAVSETHLKWYMQQGYKAKAAYYKGERYKNIYNLGGKLQFVM
ncbi:MAG: hypothetical protein IJ646_13355 [Clostridia bacterium]|nr:hypothetical protein [Clostridia bacterium]